MQHDDHWLLRFLFLLYFFWFSGDFLIQTTSRIQMLKSLSDAACSSLISRLIKCYTPTHPTHTVPTQTRHHFFFLFFSFRNRTRLSVQLTENCSALVAPSPIGVSWAVTGNKLKQKWTLERESRVEPKAKKNQSRPFFLLFFFFTSYLFYSLQHVWFCLVAVAILRPSGA